MRVFLEPRWRFACVFDLRVECLRSGAFCELLLRLYPARRLKWVLERGFSLKFEVFSDENLQITSSKPQPLNAIMLLWLKVKLSNLQIVLWLKLPTPGIFSFPSACPTSLWVTPSLILLCLNLSAKISSSACMKLPKKLWLATLGVTGALEQLGRLSRLGFRVLPGWPKDACWTKIGFCKFKLISKGLGK